MDHFGIQGGVEMRLFGDWRHPCLQHANCRQSDSDNGIAFDLQDSQVKADVNTRGYFDAENANQLT